MIYLCSDEWKVSITTGIYEPEGEENNEAETKQEEAPEEETQEEDAETNENNNANGQSDDEGEDASKSTEGKKRRSKKCSVAPKPPTSQIMVVLYGDRGKTGILPLTSAAETSSRSFQPGCPDDFKVIL